MARRKLAQMRAASLRSQQQEKVKTEKSIEAWERADDERLNHTYTNTFLYLSIKHNSSGTDTFI